MARNTAPKNEPTPDPAPEPEVPATHGDVDPSDGVPQVDALEQLGTVHVDPPMDPEAAAAHALRSQAPSIAEQYPPQPELLEP